MMVDDDIDDRQMFEEAIKTVNPVVSVNTAKNGEEALDRLAVPPPPDVIFLDLNMPVMNGYECLENLKKSDRYKDIPVIIYSTADDSATIKKTQELGAQGFFKKPAKFKDLKIKLQTLLTGVIPVAGQKELSLTSYII